MSIRCRAAIVCAVVFFACVGARAQVLTEPVGTTSPVQTATLTFTTGGTIGAINVLTQGTQNLDFNFVSGGSCAVGTPYSANATCTVEYTFKPTAPGTRYGGITLMNGNTLLASAYVFGTGTGPQVNWKPGQQLALGAGFSITNGVAVDGNGNTYVAENGNVVEIAATGAVTKFPFSGDMMDVAVDGVGNVFAVNMPYMVGGAVVNEIVAVNGSIPATPEIRTIATGSNSMRGIAVDGNGDLFLTQSYSTGTECAIYEIPTVDGIIPAMPAVLTLATSFGASTCGPTGVAVDASGDLFVADPRAVAVYELLAVNGSIPASPTIRTLGSGFNQPANIDLDAAGDVFVADFANSAVYELLAVNGSIPATNPTILTLGSGFVSPTGVAVDGSGNVFVSDVGLTHIVKLDFADPPSLSFATTPVGQTSTDSPQTITMMNSGNSPLIFSTPATGINPNITAGFTLGNSSTCPELSPGAAPATLAVGSSCTDVVSFHPVVQGTPVTGQLTTTDNALNAVGATQVVPLGGNTTLYATTSILTVSPNPAPVGTAVTLTATVTPNPASPNVPTGTVNFYDNTTLLVSVPLTSSGTASYSTSALPSGSNNLSCTYSGDTNFANSTCAPVVENITTPQSITFPQPSALAYAGTSVLLTATASSGLPVTYTVISGPATVSGSVLHYNGAGSVVVEADQSGNSTYSAAAPVQDTVTASLLTSPVGTQHLPASTVIIFSASGILGSINVLTQGAPNLDFASFSGFTGPDMCTVGTNYTAGQTCTTDFSFTPARPGLRFGGISLTSTAGVAIASSAIYGLGTGPQVIYSPATQSLLGSGLTNPSGVAVDGSGDIFVSTCIDLCDNTGTSNNNGLSEILPNGTVRNIGSFVQGDDVAVDGAGNVFIIWNRSNVSEVLAVNGVIPASPVINLLASSFISLDGMKVDGNGNVFVADGASATSGKPGGIFELLAVNGAMPASPAIVQIGANNTVLSSPTGVAIDAAGDIFESDEDTDAVYELMAVNGVVPASPVVKTLASNLPEPTNIAIDAAGNVFVSVVGPAGVYEALAQGGYSTAVPLGTGFSEADGLAVDAAGNVFVADNSMTQVAKLDFADAPSLTFATTQVGSTSTDSPQTVTISNDGNADLDPAKYISASLFNPYITAGFTFTSTCPVLFAGNGLVYVVPSGGSCAESISFTPVAAGPDSGEFTLVDNNLNVTGAQQIIPLNGTGTAAATTLTLTPSANPVYALQPVTFTVHLTTNGQGDAGQTVNLSYLYGTLVGTALLTTDSTGTASYMFPTLPPLDQPGSYRVSAVFVGTTSYQSSSAAITEVVNAIPTTSTLTVFPAQPVVNTNIVLTAVVTAQLSGPATGTVTFFNGTTTLGTVVLSSAGIAQYTITSLPTGNYSFTCTYNGATDYATSTCPTIAETVVPIPDFSLTATPPSITIETQHHKTMQLTLTGIGLFSGPVYLQCEGPLPPYLSCGLPSSETLAVGQTLNFNLVMDTDAVLDFLAATRPEKTPWTNAPGRMVLAMLLPLALAGFARRRKTLRRMLLLAVLVIGATGLTACGDKWPGHTPPGTYTIPIVGTGAANGTTITHTLNITLTVTP